MWDFSPHVDVRVNIHAIYDVPYDLTFPSPPYYHPASLLRLECVVQGALEPVSYHWTTNSSDPFFSTQQTSGNLTLYRLTVSSVGEYTCSVTDAHEFVVTASTSVLLIGKQRS